MSGAFGGDASVKAQLLARIDSHIAAGTLDVERDLPWSEGGGTPLGLSIEGADPADYARAFGYPLALAAALDPLARETGDGFDGVAFARDWVAVVIPGADLSDVPGRLILHMLDGADLDRSDQPLTDEIAAFHQMGLNGAPPSAMQWSALRSQVAEREALAQGPRRTAIAGLWSAACWPAGRGRSVLVSTLQAWRRLEALPKACWSDEQEALAMAMLNAIWDDQQTQRDSGHEPDYIALFRERDPSLADGFEANLSRSNQRFLNCGVEIAQLCLALFQECPLRTTDCAGDRGSTRHPG